VNLVGASAKSKFKIPNRFLKRWGKKLRKNRNFYAKSIFDKIGFGFGVTLKQMAEYG